MNIYEWNKGPIVHEHLHALRDHRIMCLYPEGIAFVLLEYKRSRWKWTLRGGEVTPRLASCIAFKAMEK